MRILVVDDDKALCDVIKRGLEEDSYAVDCVHNGEDGVDYAESGSYNLVILDVMMPVKDGLAVCRTLREKKIHTPVLMLTAKDAVEDRVRGLDTGADDYLVKPFVFAELSARVRALLRREGTTRAPEISVGDLVLDTVTREVRWKNRPLDLTTKEYLILSCLMRRPGAVVSRRTIEESAWDYEFDSLSNVVDVYIRRLRGKIDPVEGKRIIRTVRGAGYRIEAP